MVWFYLMVKIKNTIKIKKYPTMGILEKEENFMQ